MGYARFITHTLETPSSGARSKFPTASSAFWSVFLCPDAVLWTALRSCLCLHAHGTTCILLALHRAHLVCCLTEMRRTTTKNILVQWVSAHKLRLFQSVSSHSATIYRIFVSNSRLRVCRVPALDILEANSMCSQDCYAQEPQIWERSVISIITAQQNSSTTSSPEVLRFRFQPLDYSVQVSNPRWSLPQWVLGASLIVLDDLNPPCSLSDHSLMLTVQMQMRRLLTSVLSQTLFH